MGFTILCQFLLSPLRAPPCSLQCFGEEEVGLEPSNGGDQCQGGSCRSLWNQLLFVSKSSHKSKPWAGVSRELAAEEPRSSQAICWVIPRLAQSFPSEMSRDWANPAFSVEFLSLGHKGMRDEFLLMLHQGQFSNVE